MSGFCFRSVLTGLMVSAGLLVVGCGGGSSSAGGESGCGSWPDLYQLPAADSHSNIKSLLVIDECNLLVGGYDRSPHGSEPEGNSRGFIRKLELLGGGRIAERWTWWMNTSGTDAVLQLDRHGADFLFLGVTTGTLSGQRSFGAKDVVAGRLDGAGNLIHITQFGNERPNVPLKWLLLGSGERYLVGSDDPYIPTNFVDRWEDPWIASVSEHANGFAVNWWQNADTDQQDIHTAAVAVDPYLVLARFTFNGAAAGMSIDVMDSGGATIWQRRLGPSPYDYVADLALDSDGNLLAYGTTYLQLGDQNFGAGDYFLQKLDITTGDEQWTRQWGDAELNWAGTMLADQLADQLANQNKRIMLGATSPGTYPWAIDLSTSAGDATPVLQKSRQIGDSTQVEDAKALAGSVLVAGHFDTDGSASVGYIAKLTVP